MGRASRWPTSSTRSSALFAAGERPTGTRDPFGLRRQAHGLLKMLVDLPELTGLDAAVDLAALRSGSAGRARRAAPSRASRCRRRRRPSRDDLSTFLGERLRYLFQQRGFAYDEVNAIAGSPARLRWPCPLDARLRLEALQRVRASADFEALAVAFKRVKNLVARAEGRARRDAWTG